MECDRGALETNERVELNEEGKERGPVQTRLHKESKKTSEERMWGGGEEQRGRRAVDMS